MTRAFHAADRQVLAVGGSQRHKFLQDLVTNDVSGVDDGLVYAALLTPQGKYLADFFLTAAPGREAILLDVHADLAVDLARRLAMYKLRADVTIDEAGLSVLQGVGDPPAGALPDPRHPALGWRLYTEDPAAALLQASQMDPFEWTALRVRHAVPEAGVELIPGDSFILEAGFGRLNGVDFRKGCYVGQEVTARMRHKTQLKKGLARVAVDGAPPPPGTAIESAEGKPAGTLFTVTDGAGLAHLRFDRAQGPLRAGQAVLHWDGAQG